MKEVKEYHSNEKLSRHYWRNEKDNLEGEYKSWHSNGQPFTHCFFKNGAKEGEYKCWWYNNGQLTEHIFYHNDIKIDITEYVEDVNNIIEHEYFQLYLTFGYFPIIKFDGEL